ncbi:6-phosphogluconolactonase [Gleimia coleocanis DSM 15436]|uniref:6-phosphogluconolactonase n=1 Tax=Gleimia coleocanis DSM 15436 TaxID=525245 RepID=C0W1H0_9ACTO|nr:6-phosphogluconolactonase [Gleimia coleocanis]EEH63336.1 6-phosphogluconolactonase [Gleimia coleocanis DSM 15436]
MFVDSDLRVYPNVNELYAKVAKAFIQKISELSQQRSRIQLGVSGGSVAMKLLPKIAQLLEAHPEIMDAWVPIHVWLVDERHVELDSPERTSSIVRRELVDKFPIFTLHDAPVPSEVPDPFSAAAIYAQKLSDVFTPSQVGDDVVLLKARTICLDFALLGLGPDGHFASLFPSHETLYEGGLMTAETESPKPPAQRITMTLELLRRTRVSWFIVSGADKAVVLSHAVHGADYREVPASVMNQVGTIWWCDAPAASKVNGIV